MVAPTIRLKTWLRRGELHYRIGLQSNFLSTGSEFVLDRSNFANALNNFQALEKFNLVN